MIVRTVRVVLEFVAAVFVGAALAVALLAWRLSGEPLSLTFLTPYFQQALSAEDGSFSVRLDDTVLTWAGWERTLDVRLLGVRAIGAKGETLAAVPEMSVSISARGLLRGIVAPTRLEVMGADVRVTRAADGHFQFGLEGSGEAAGDIISRVITDLLAPPHAGRAMGYLSRVSVSDAELALIDEKLGTSWRAPRADISLSRGRRGVSGDLSLDLETDGRTAHLDAEVEYDSASRKVEVGAAFANVALAHLAAKGPAFAGLAGLDLPLGGTVAATMDIDGRVEILGFDLTGGRGRIGIPDLFPDPVEVLSVHARGRFEENLARLVVDDFSVDLGGPRGEVTGRVVRAGGDLAIQGEAVLRGMPVDSFDRYWPPKVGADARAWVLPHLSAGRVKETRAAFAAYVPGGDFAAARLESLAGTFTFSGLDVDYLPPMPQVRDAKGRAAFTRERIDFEFTDAALQGIRVQEGTLAITDLHLKDQDADLEVVVRGPLRNTLEVLDHEPLGAAEYLGLEPEDVGGEMATRMRFRFPLRKDLALEHVEVVAAANLADVSLEGAALGHDLTRGRLSLTVNKTALKLEGRADLGGIPVTLASTETFSEEAEFRSRHALKARVDDGDLARLGFTVAPYLRGPAGVDLVYTVTAADAGELSVTADLKDAVLAFEGIDWSKPAGTAGTVRFAVSLVGERATRVNHFALVAGDLTAAGSAEFAAEAGPGAADGPGLRWLEFSRLAFGRNDVTGMVAFRPDGGYDVELGGAAIDAARFFAVEGAVEGEEEAEEEEKLPPFRLLAKVAALWVGPESQVTDAECTIVHDGEVWQSLSLQGRMAREAEAGRFAVQIAPDRTTRALSVASDNAGVFLSTFGYFENMRGGTLKLTGSIDDTVPERPLTGDLEIENYRLIRAPVLAKLLTAASLTGILNLLAGEGIGFSKLKAPFDLRGNILDVKEARAYGPDLGLTFKGKIDLRTDAADIEGTLVPAYAINSILGNLPLLGDLLTGGGGSGVFAATYKLRGSLDDPKVTLNPLAAFTPGILRNIFRIFDRPAPEIPEPDKAKPEKSNANPEGSNANPGASKEKSPRPR